MALTMFWQQKITPTPSTAGNSEQAKMQQSMMKIMPVMMLVMLYKFPSGLALYWATQNMLMIVQHYVYKKRKERKAAHAEA